MKEKKCIALQLVESIGENPSITISSDVVYKLHYEYLELEKQIQRMYAQNTELMSNNKILTEKIRTLKKQLKELLNK